MRNDWSKQMSNLLKPGGILIALIFPIDGERTDGPPFSMSPDLHQQLLSQNFKLEYLEKPKIEVENKDRKMMGVWRRL